METSSFARGEFELWAEGLPYPVSTERQPEGSVRAGEYNDTGVELAYQAWMESTKRVESCVAASTQDSTCHLFRTADAFREWMIQSGECRGCVLAWINGVVLHG